MTCFVRAAILLAAVGCGDPSASVQIASSNPDYGPVVGGTRIVLSGNGFSSPTRVLIGGREAPLSAPIGDSMLEIITPPGAQPGDAEVVVLNDRGNARATGVFHYSAPPTLTGATPKDVLFSSTSTRITLTGSGFLDEGAGDVTVLVDGEPANDVQVASDTSLTFMSVFGRAFAEPDIELVDGRGSATERRAFRYVPSTHRGLLLFPVFGSDFAVFFDPSDNSTVAIPRINAPIVRFTSVVRDEHGEYWGVDRSRQFGRIDMNTQTLEAPVQTLGWFPTMIRVGADYFAIERGTLQFGKLDHLTGRFSSIGATTLPCCGSYGLASDGTSLYFTARQAETVNITTIDTATGAAGTPVPIIASPDFHVEEMRFLDGVLYASSRDQTLVTIDPQTGVTTVLPVFIGRCNAMAIFE
ncbi:MAG: hypothetical protein JWO36_3345 [Myxococcales bacterium]|nr:hypothetical protein [Myxococcales bacterium]